MPSEEYHKLNCHLMESMLTILSEKSSSLKHLKFLPLFLQMLDQQLSGAFVLLVTDTTEITRYTAVSSHVVRNVNYKIGKKY